MTMAMTVTEANAVNVLLDYLVSVAGPGTGSEQAHAGATGVDSQNPGTVLRVPDGVDRERISVALTVLARGAYGRLHAGWSEQEIRRLLEDGTVPDRIRRRRS